MKIMQELDEAIKKHGKVELPPLYEDEFYKKINKRKQELAA